jgi:hypothetical protein
MSSKRYWEDLNNQRKYLFWLEEELGITKPDDWYNITQIEVEMRGGRRLLDTYGDSLINALKCVFPERHFNTWQFTHAPPGFWNTESNIRQFLKWVESKLDICSPSDWYNITHTQFASLGGTTLLINYGGLSGILTKFYPNYLPDASNLPQVKSQSLLLAVVKKVFNQM